LPIFPWFIKKWCQRYDGFRPISLIHAISNLITKMMATWISHFMNTLVSNAKSTFIKKHSIHDNFMYVRNVTRKFHHSKTPRLLLKFDIKKAYYLVCWDYFMDVLMHNGLPPKFCDWLSIILSTSTSWVLLMVSHAAMLSH
jgi:hypothetical protein